VLSVDRAVIMWSSVPAAGLFGRRRMAIIWTAVSVAVFASNLHFFWIAELHMSTSPMIDRVNSEQSGFGVADDQLLSNSEASAVSYNYSALQSTSDTLTTSSSSLAFPEHLAVLATSTV